MVRSAAGHAQIWVTLPHGQVAGTLFSVTLCLTPAAWESVLAWKTFRYTAALKGDVTRRFRNRLHAAIQKDNTLYDLAEYNMKMTDNSILKCSCSTEAQWLSNAEKLICQGPLLADMLKYNFAECNITPSGQMNGRIRQE